MIVTTPKGNTRAGQLSQSYSQQLDDHETRRALTARYSTAISVANHQRNQFMDELNQLLLKYENQY